MKTYHTIVFQQSEGGNPCPVTLNADALSTEEMQEMTRKFSFESVLHVYAVMLSLRTLLSDRLLSDTFLSDTCAMICPLHLF